MRTADETMMALRNMGRMETRVWAPILWEEAEALFKEIEHLRGLASKAEGEVYLRNRTIAGLQESLELARAERDAAKKGARK